MPEFTGRGTALTNGGLAQVSHLAEVGLPEIWSVIRVETKGCGFIQDRRPQLLFERHKFHHWTNGRFDATHSDISQPTQGGYGAGGAHQYDRLAEAIGLDREAALKSASWGIGQVMGENFATAGFRSVGDMVTSMVESEDNQLAAVARFMVANRMHTALRNHDWSQFARMYNGPNFKQNNYDDKLRDDFTDLTNNGLPDVLVRSAQVYLTYRGFSPGVIDGVMGRNTAGAITQFQKSIGVPQTGVANDALITQLLT